jgi:hypothetical protein
MTVALHNISVVGLKLIQEPDQPLLAKLEPGRVVEDVHRERRLGVIEIARASQTLRPQDLEIRPPLPATPPGSQHQPDRQSIFPPYSEGRKLDFGKRFAASASSRASEYFNP